MIGVFQIYEYTVLRNEATHNANTIQLGKWISRISELNSDNAIRVISADTLEKRSQAFIIGSIVSNEKLSIIRLADQLMQEQPNTGGFTAYIVMASEMLNQGNNQKALTYARNALTSSETMPERIASMRQVASVLFTPGSTQDIDVARKTFQDTLALVEANKSSIKEYLTAKTLSNLAMAEALFGSCNEAELAIKKLHKEFSSTNHKMLLQVSLNEIYSAIKGNTNCPSLSIE